MRADPGLFKDVVADFLVIGDDKKGANLFKVCPRSQTVSMCSSKDLLLVDAMRPMP